jgi:hypothetical protein
MGQKITRAIRYICNRRNIIYPKQKVYDNINELLYDYSNYVDQFISNGQIIHLNHILYNTHNIFNNNFNILLDNLVSKYGLVNTEHYVIQFNRLNRLFLIRLRLLYNDKKLIIPKNAIEYTDIMQLLNN